MEPSQQTPFARFSTTCENTALNFTDFPPIDQTFVGNYREAISCGLRLPLDVSDSVVLKFPIGESPFLWIDPMQTALHLQFQAVNKDGMY